MAAPEPALVSVVVPALNEAEGIAAALASVAAQPTVGIGQSPKRRLWVGSRAWIGQSTQQTRVVRVGIWIGMMKVLASITVMPSSPRRRGWVPSPSQRCTG